MRNRIMWKRMLLISICMSMMLPSTTSFAMNTDKEQVLQEQQVKSNLQYNEQYIIDAVKETNRYRISNKLLPLTIYEPLSKAANILV